MRKQKILHNQSELCNEITTQAYYKGTQHDFSMFVVFEGSERYTVGKKDLTIYPDYLLTLNPGAAYEKTVYSNAPVNSFSISFSKEFISDFRNSLFRTDFELYNEPDVMASASEERLLETIYPFQGDLKYNLIHLFHHFYNSPDELLIDEYLYHSLLLFYRTYHKEVINKVTVLEKLKPATRQELFKRLCVAKDYILSNYNQAIGFEDISRYACLSPCHLYRYFKKIYHQSPHEFLVKVRLQNASYLLKHSNYELKEIVNCVGFSCPSSFIKLFKNHFTVTPLEYRKRAA